MEKTILLIGLGQFGYHMAVKMKELKSQVLGIDIDEERVNNCLPYLTSAKIADSTDEAFLRTLGVRNFDVCVVTISGNFQASLETTALLKDAGAKLVVSRASSEFHAKFLLRNGADEVLYPERDMAIHGAVKCTPTMSGILSSSPTSMPSMRPPCRPNGWARASWICRCGKSTT